MIFGEDTFFLLQHRTITPKNQFVVSHAFISSAINNQNSNKSIAMTTPAATNCFLFIIRSFLFLEASPPPKNPLSEAEEGRESGDN